MAMEIINFHVQHILRAYSQQLADGSRVSRGKVNKNPVQKDEVTISTESKKRLLVDKIALGIIDQFSNGSEISKTGREILDRLSQEYGQPLEVSSNDGGMVFKVLDKTNGQGVKFLSPQENDQLKKRLFDIAQSIVYNAYNDIIKEESL